MEIIEFENRLEVRGLSDFDPKHIFECGQCFRWDLESDGSYTGVAFEKILNVKKEEDLVIFTNTNKKEFQEIWMPYFDLERDYGQIKKILGANDPIMTEASNFGYGIRILQQDPWETLISFIISSNNGIPRIRKSVKLLSERYGKYLGTFKEKEYYAFPKPEDLKDLADEDLTACGVGYRSKYILCTAEAVVNGENTLEDIKGLKTSECLEQLLKFSGVGPKVANCILFFAMGKVDAFPVDVWIKRIMEYFYFKEDTPNKVIEKFALERFGAYAGYAQQYLFYYGRETAVGK